MNTVLYRVALVEGSSRFAFNIGAGPFEYGLSMYEALSAAGFGSNLNSWGGSYHSWFPGPYGDGITAAESLPCAVDNWPMFKAWWPDCLVPVFAKHGFEVLVIRVRHCFRGRHQVTFDPNRIISVTRYKPEVLLCVRPPLP